MDSAIKTLGRILDNKKDQTTPVQVTRTYDYINGHMVLNGFFIYGGGEPLRHVKLADCEVI